MKDSYLYCFGYPPDKVCNRISGQFFYYPYQIGFGMHLRYWSGPRGPGGIIITINLGPCELLLRFAFGKLIKWSEIKGKINEQ